MRYLVIDGYALAYRAWYSFNNMKNDNGRDCRVPVGFFWVWTAYEKANNLSSYQPIFVFDHPVGSFRKKLSKEYKANRTPAPQEFYDQVEETINLCKMIAPTYRLEGYEADDLAGTFAAKVNPDDEVLLLTVDTDWLQLLSDNVKCLQLKTRGQYILWDKYLFCEKYQGLTPKQLIDVKAITGDGSDNIPGVKGIGWVTVHKLLREYHDVDNIYDKILEIKNTGGVQKKLYENKDQVILSRTLATIATDAPIELYTKEPDLDSFFNYLNNELNADSLVNTMGFYFAKLRSALGGVHV